MRLGSMGVRERNRPPLRTVSEIAESLNISKQQLMWALKRDGAPKPIIKAREASHCVTGNNKVWYEPLSVIKWWREYETSDPAASRREYHRNRYESKKAAK